MAKINTYLVIVSLSLAMFAFPSTHQEKFIRSPPCKLDGNGLCLASSASLLSTSDATPTGSNFTYVCDPSRLSKLGLGNFTFCDTSLPYHIRAKDLVDRMTLEEKVLQLIDNASGVARLGLPKYEWWSEALHGVSNVGGGSFFDPLVPGATSFPTPILSVSAFNTTLWQIIGQAVSTEARAMYNLGRAGLTFWSPTMNVARDPRWGRILETPGEDPFIVGTYASTYVRGLQDVDEGFVKTKMPQDLNSRPLKVAACCKHYAAYDVDNWKGTTRFKFDARVTEQDMVETFVRPFEMCVKDGDVSSVMCSYNRVNGIPTCADPKLLNQTIRGEWNLHGYIVSDCDSIQVMVDDHKFLGETKEDAVAQTLKAGMDLDCGNTYAQFTTSAVQQGKVRVSDIDRSLRYLYIVLMRLGYFDGNPKFKDLGKKDICSNINIELATEAARQGIVLLKNDNGTLPLSKTNSQTLAVVGPHANATGVMIGNYAGVPCRYTSPIDGLSAYSNVSYAPGCPDVQCPNASFIPPALNAAKTADATIIVVGLNLQVEAEGLDRADLLLPGLQPDLIKQVANVSKGPVILVIMSAGGVDISFVNNIPKIKAILWVGYPGQEGGRAIADVVFGQHNPSGRLPITWHEANYVNQLPMTSMPLRPIGKFPGRTYRFFDGPVVYPFGFGLSYTKFTYKITSSNPSISKNLDRRFVQCRDIVYKSNNGTKKPQCPGVLINDIECPEQIFFDLAIYNVGGIDGSETVLVYSKPPDGIVGTHFKQVVGFQKVFVPARGSKVLKFVLNVCKSLGIVDNGAYNILPSGVHTIIIGDGGLSFPFQVNFN